MATKHQIMEQVRVLRLKHNDTVVIVKWPEMTKDDRKSIVNSLTKKAERQHLYGITILFVDKFSNVRTLNEKQMNANGWTRKTQ